EQDVVEFRSAINGDRITHVRLEGSGRGNPQSVGTRLHLGKFEFAVAVGIYGGAHSVRRDQLDAYAFRGIAALDAHDTRCATGEPALNRPLVRLRPIPGIHRRIFALDAALSGVDVGDQVGHI